MEKKEALKISNLLSQFANIQSKSFSVKRFGEAKPLHGFHQWADGLPLISADEIKSANKIINLLVIAWKEAEPSNYYCVLFPQPPSGPRMEAWKTEKYISGAVLHWTYAPKKHDQNNLLRIEAFKEYLRSGSNRIEIRLPNNTNEIQEFLGRLFEVMAAREFAEESLVGGAVDEIIEDVEAIKSNKTLTETTKEALIQARKGQGAFRRQLEYRWGGCCAVTGCRQREVLRASHIKPWRQATHDERLNPCNGLLLSANIDALFDKFLLSFKDNGTMLLSERIPASERKLLQLPVSLREKLKAEEMLFLAHHRKSFQGAA